MLGVSEVTIRRDLERLEKEQVLTRTHGGAVLREEEVQYKPLPDKKVMEPFREISRIALQMVENEDLILLTAGDSACAISEKMAMRSGVTVLTNDIPAALLLSPQKENKVILVGGDIKENGKSLYGSVALANLRRFHVNKVFVEVDGVNEDLSFSVSSHEKAEFLEAAFKISSKLIIICPSRSFGNNAFCRVHLPDNNYTLITDHELAEKFKSLFFQNNIRIYTSIDLFEGSV
jgi:DeoR/GlpR family transcriptional regulator of sugar metabolism